MKKAFLKTICFVAVISFIAIGTSSNACDKTEIRCRLSPKTARPVPQAAKPTADYPDFILTNSILRF
jgi:hypothetical protein